MSKILIVGGSKGIGHSLLQKCLDEKYECVNISRSAPQISHQNLTNHSLDITKDELPDIEGISSIVYCPGTINLKPISSLSEEDFLNDFQINVLGAVKVIKKYFRKLKKAENASITLFSTVAATQGMSFHSSIATSKAGLEGLARSLAAELAPDVRVNCIAPTLTDTELAAGILKNDEAVEKSKQRHPLKKILEAEDLSEMALYLISKKSRAITGQTFLIDAGLSSIS
ncbi:SDR family NAD(P)-dependent oxidoreductase [Sediminitomix flava]|uniref:NAD(P)-dependent dehydrogenase (Short-subunit alcohol dehydrogenase family) n=1 Tax=Sediminitomix flava TaxID=379075 RepID=A0A315Z6Z9_SEDFL|nr:SDR family oxidoreductase [Sediminitomix flava]PWJ40187.1 NAD(P)-dependent dehydrogenase (short-subunit alcohol dehydrogenase family) [Sediminitomix flava]